MQVLFYRVNNQSSLDKALFIEDNAIVEAWLQVEVGRTDQLVREVVKLGTQF